MATKVKDNNKYFYKYINSKRRAGENLHPLLDIEGSLVTRIRIRLRYLMPPLPQSLIVRLVTSWEHSPPVLVHRDGEQNRPCMIHDEVVLDLLQKLDARVHGARWTAPYLSARVGYGMDNVGIN